MRFIAAGPTRQQPPTTLAPASCQVTQASARSDPSGTPSQRFAAAFQASPEFG